MRIIVIIRHIPLTSQLNEYDGTLGRIDPQDIVYGNSNYDLQAVEEAIRIREQFGGIINVIGIGPPWIDAMLRECLAMGTDAAFHICDPLLDGSDAYGLSLAVSRAIKRLEYDLILCGAEAVDDFGCTIFLGPYVAEMLGLPHVSGVTMTEMKPEAREAMLYRKIEGGDREAVLCPLPCLLTVEQGGNEPRYPIFPESLASITKEIKLLDLASLDLDPTEVGPSGSLVKFIRFSPPRARVKKGLVIDTKLSPMERMRMVRSGGTSSKKTVQTVLAGKPKELAEKILLMLRQHGIIEMGNQNEV